MTLTRQSTTSKPLPVAKPSKTALLVIDAQQSFTALDSWGKVSAPDIADRIAKLVDHHRSRGDDVVWILHTEPGSGTPFDPALGRVQLLPGLAARSDELVLRKTSHNAFTTTNLGQQLTRAGIGRVVISGIRTEQCCETTARVASDLGYSVDFILDATATHPLASWDGGAELSVGEVMARTASALSGRFGTVTTLESQLRSRPTPVD